MRPPASLKHREHHCAAAKQQCERARLGHLSRRSCRSDKEAAVVRMPFGIAITKHAGQRDGTYGVCRYVERTEGVVVAGGGLV